MRENISKEDLKRGRVGADNASTGVSAGHDEGFNEVEQATTSPNDSAPRANPPRDTDSAIVDHSDEALPRD